MGIVARTMSECDRESFVKLSCGLTRFNYYTRPESERNYNLEESQKARVEWCSKNFDQLLSSSDKFGFMALLNGEPAGYAVAYTYPDNSGLLDELFVSEKFRGKGIGKVLMDESTRWLKGKGCSKMLIKVYQWNRNAMDFYEREGFEKFIVTYSKDLSVK